MKKINKIIILNLIVIIVSLVNANFVSGQACGPTPFPCISTDACGYNECNIAYTACDSSASSTCTTQVSQCETQYSSCLSGCFGPQAAACQSACQATRTACIATAESTYAGSQASCRANAEGIQDARRVSGTFAADIVPCGEMNSCVAVGDIGKFTSFSRLNDCNSDMSPNMKARVLENHPASQWEGHLPNTFENNNLIQAGKQLSPENLAQRISTGGLQDSVVIETNAETLAHEAVRAVNRVELPLLKQAEVLYHVVNNNQFVKAAKYIKAAYSGVQFLSGLGSGESSSAAQDINYARSNQAAGTSTWASTNTVTDNVDGASQCTNCIPSNWEIKFGTLHVIDTDRNNMYSLKGFDNKGVVYETDDDVRIGAGGTTKISVAGEGAFTEDVKNNELVLGGGTHTYLGTGTEDVDVYVSNSAMLHLGSDTLFDATKDKSGDEFGKISLKKLTGAAAFKPSEGRLAASFDHFTLPNYQNAIDLGKITDGYQLLARGFGDMVLLGNEKFFPLLVRNFLKGDSAIVFNKDVKVINTYVARDNTYDYIIKADNESTKVIARNQKIIQDSSGLPLELTPRQRNLIYAD